MSAERVGTVVIGAGHAGLAMSALLSEGGREHLVLERRAKLGGAWQDRWDAFRLVSPNFTASFPGYAYDGPDPDAFMPRDEIAGRVANYASRIDAPVRLETAVRQLSVRLDGGFRLETSQGLIDADQVVVAVGGFHRPRIPPVSSELPGRLHQVHSQHYRNESELPPGAVLVVGSGQSGVQIAEELAEAGRHVFLSVGTAGRMPRIYRGRDIFRWMWAVVAEGELHGVALPTVDELPDPRIRFAGNPHLSGHRGGHEVDLREMAASGTTLLSRIERVQGEHLDLAGDLERNLDGADAFFGMRFGPIIDRFIVAAGIDAPPDDRQPYPHMPPDPSELDLTAEGIANVVWATGYQLDFGWIDLPIFGERGMPNQERGVTEVPGLYFLGLHWMHSQASGTLFGVSYDARHIARHMGLVVG